MKNPLTRFAPFLVGEFPKPFLELLSSVTHHDQLSESELKTILWKAYEFGSRFHESQKRLSGELYFESHCVEVAKILANWNMDHITIIGGLLHDTIEDTHSIQLKILKKISAYLPEAV